MQQPSVSKESQTANTAAKALLVESIQESEPYDHDAYLRDLAKVTRLDKQDEAAK